MGPEITFRSKSSAANSGSFRKAVVAKSHLPGPQLANLADSMMASSLLFNSQTWVGLNDSDLDRIQVGLAHSYGAVVRDKVYSVAGSLKRIPDVAVFAEVGRHDAATQISIRRLRFIQRVLLNGSHALVSLVDLGSEIPGQAAGVSTQEDNVDFRVVVVR